MSTFIVRLLSGPDQPLLVRIRHVRTGREITCTSWDEVRGFLQRMAGDAAVPLPARGTPASPDREE